MKRTIGKRNAPILEEIHGTIIIKSPRLITNPIFRSKRPLVLRKLYKIHNSFSFSYKSLRIFSSSNETTCFSARVTKRANYSSNEKKKERERGNRDRSFNRRNVLQGHQFPRRSSSLVQKGLSI